MAHTCHVAAHPAKVISRLSALYWVSILCCLGYNWGMLEREGRWRELGSSIPVMTALFGPFIHGQTVTQEWHCGRLGVLEESTNLWLVVQEWYRLLIGWDYQAFRTTCYYMPNNGAGHLVLWPPSLLWKWRICCFMGLAECWETSQLHFLQASLGLFTVLYWQREFWMSFSPSQTLLPPLMCRNKRECEFCASVNF